jgi:hypothetical protein
MKLKSKKEKNELLIEMLNYLINTARGLRNTYGEVPKGLADLLERATGEKIEDIL